MGTAAAEAGYRVRCTLASKLVDELVEAADDKQLSKTINRYGRVDLLCLDDLGYMELDKRGAELLFQVLTEREERSAVAIAPTKPSPAGPRPLPSPACVPPSRTASRNRHHQLLPGSRPGRTDEIR